MLWIMLAFFLVLQLQPMCLVTAYLVTSMTVAYWSSTIAVLVLMLTLGGVMILLMLALVNVTYVRFSMSFVLIFALISIMDCYTPPSTSLDGLPNMLSEAHSIIFFPVLCFSLWMLASLIS